MTLEKAIEVGIQALLKTMDTAKPKPEQCKFVI